MFEPPRVCRTTLCDDGSVHPCSRGERRGRLCRRGCCLGSSPLARGTLQLALDLPEEARFIPARAGNAGCGRAPQRGSAVHPRSRGERNSGSLCSVSIAGSSPLARVTLSGMWYRWRCRRFIPARAGNAAAVNKIELPAAVHPRSRGERWPVDRWGVDTGGSSPLARGTRCHLCKTIKAPRFIPARAGNARFCPERRRSASVHPRSRGERLMFDGGEAVQDGSSPLARGTPPTARRSTSGRRFIPARAGNAG